MIVLDTHALVWWVAGDSRLSRPACEAIDTGTGWGRIGAFSICMMIAG